MLKKKLHLKNLKVKSFVTVMSKTEQKTTKGGFVDMSDHMVAYESNWTTVKTQKEPGPLGPRYGKAKRR